MIYGDTIRRLDEVTDEGVFERLATAVLRQSDPDCRWLAHTGMNVDGKTVKASLDAVTFVPGAAPPHMIAVHHTICERDALKAKWLHDPAKVTPRKGGKPTAPAGDMVKTAQVYKEKQKQMPGLRATLILTTNREPSVDLINDANAAASSFGLTLKITSASALAHYLDTDPDGQLIRNQHLGVEQERLSADLLAELSRSSIERHRPPDDRGLWIDRELDRTLAGLVDRELTFLVGDSGLGKSIAAYRKLAVHLESGGYGLVVPHEILAASSSLDQAVELTLQQLQPSLAPGSGRAARSIASVHSPLLPVVEDVNKAQQPAVLIEKLSGWGPSSESGAATHRIICPVWPKILSALRDEVRKHVDVLAASATSFTESEGVAAVQRRQGQRVTTLEATAIANALGHDPLLIALHDPGTAAQPDLIIGRFIDRGLERLSASKAGEFTPAEYAQALNRLAQEMLTRKHLAPSMFDIRDWFIGDPATVTMIRHIAHFGETLRLTGVAASERLDFRHDRVRGHLLAISAAALMREGALASDILAEPYFAEILGLALSRSAVPAETIEEIKTSNFLALICALRAIGPLSTQYHRDLLKAAEDWLRVEENRGIQNSSLIWESLRVLAEIEAPYVRPLAKLFNLSLSWPSLSACFRNGDFVAGVTLCAQIELGTRVLGHRELIQYVKRRHAGALEKTLTELLQGNALAQGGRIGALRLAGHLRDNVLAGAVATSWQSDTHRNENLSDYLWATAQCCGDHPETLLGPACDAWAALSDEEKEFGITDRNSLAAHTVRFAFRDGINDAGLRYIIERAKSSELNWPITYMLHGVDHPDAVEFIARGLGDTAKEIEGTDRISPFADRARDEWKHLQQQGHPMSSASKERLRTLWVNEVNDKHLRVQAFRLWAASVSAKDVAILRLVKDTDILADLAVSERLTRSDRSAVEKLLPRLGIGKYGHWWQFCRSTWSAELTRALDDELAKRGRSIPREWDFDEKNPKDWITSEMTMRLPLLEAESMLVRHWDHLKYSPRFVQAALYVATPELAKAVAAIVANCPNPKSLFQYLTMHLGFNPGQSPGVVRIEQIEGLLPYLHHLSDMDLSYLWDTCNDRGWFELRRNHFDSRVNPRHQMYIDRTGAMAELDRLVARNETYWGTRFADKLIESGTPVDEIMELLRDWLSDKRSIVALQIAANIIVHAGRRPDITVLAIGKIEPSEPALLVAKDAAFGVKRRSLR